MSEFHFNRPAAPIQSVLAVQVAALIFLAVCVFAGNALLKSGRDSVRDLRATIAQAEVTRQQATEETGPAFFFNQATPPLAQAALSDALQDLANQFEIELEVLQAGEVERVGGNLQLALVATGVVPEPQLGAFLDAIARARPAILVSDINLRRARNLNRREPVRKIAFELDLNAYLKG